MFGILICMLFFTAAGEKEHGPAGDTLDDGPHVYWSSDSTAVVFYCRGRDLVWKRFDAAEELAFTGFGSWDAGTAYSIPQEYQYDSEYRIQEPGRFMVLSDLHGDYQAFRDILTAGGVIDSIECWTWGEGHLVIDGDVFDRGPRVTECLWLIYRLQIQAEEAGGGVHMTLGNHEAMVLRGDLRYVNDRYLKGICEVSGIHYDELYGPDTELGRWLRSMPVVIIMGDNLIVHAGIAPSHLLDHRSPSELNSMAEEALDCSRLRLKFGRELLDILGSTGPFWYRGYHYEMEGRYHMATVSQVDEILDRYGVSRIIVGHTEVDSLSVLFDGRVMAVDVPVGELGGQQALLWQDGSFFRLDADGSATPLF